MVTVKSRSVYVICFMVAIVTIYVIGRQRRKIEKFAEQQQPILAWTSLTFNASTGGTGQPVNVKFGSDNTVACLNSKRAISIFNGTQWTTIPGTFRKFSMKDANNIIGIGEDFSVYLTTSAKTSTEWTRLASSRFESVTIGWDGTVWATTLPIGGSWSIYTYSTGTKSWVQVPGSMKQVSALSASNVWGLDPQGTPWKWDGQQWIQQPGQFSKVSVGADGSVWAINNQGIISRLQQDTKTWQQLKGTFSDFSAKDAGTIVVIDSAAEIAIGSIASAGPVAMQQATPFTMSAYSGGSTRYSDYQQSPTAWAQLIVNGTAILDKSNSGNGFNIIALSSTGKVSLLKTYDLKQSSAMGSQLAQDFASLASAQKSLSENSPTNLYGGYTGGKVPSSNFSVSLTDHLLYTGLSADGYYPANVRAGTYTLSFRYKGAGLFQISQTGVDSGNVSDTLTGTSVWQTYAKKIIHTQDGLHKLSFQNKVLAQTEIEHPTLTAITKTPTGQDISLIIVLAQGDLGPSNIDVLSAFQGIGSSTIDNVSGNTSYVFIYNPKTGNIVNEQISQTGHVLFESNGPAPVLKATWSIPDTTSPGVLNIINQGVFVQYDMAAASIKRSVSLKSSSLPAPFSTGIDAVYPMPDGKTYLMTRGKLWLTTTDLTTLSVNSGPGVIGQGFLSGINASPFTTGIQAMTPSPDGNAYVFSFDSFAKVNAGLTIILASGKLGAKNTDFAGLPSSFQSKIDSAFLSGNSLGLLAGDKLLYYDPKRATVLANPISILSNPMFLGLPISFKANSTNTMKPFFNQTVFPQNRIKNFDISTQTGQGYPGWDISAFQTFNQNIAFNVIDPPIKVASFTTMFPDVATTYGNDTNILLKAFESNDGRWLGVPTYGGNVVSFTIVDPTKTSFWLSYANSSGTPFNYADLQPCEFYTLSVWVRTNDPQGLTVGAETGTPADFGVTLSGVQIKNGDGWQLLSWDFYNPANSTAKDVSFTLLQATNNQNILHSLYGPVLLCKASLLPPKLMTKIDEAGYVYLNLGGRYLTYDGTYLTFSTTASLDSRFSLHTSNGSVYLTSFSRYASDGRPLNLVTDGKACSMTSAQDSSAIWVVLEDEDDSVYFVHRATDTILQMGGDGKPTVATCKDTLESQSLAAFVFSIDPPIASKVTPVYIDAAFTQQSSIVLIKGNVFTSYDTRQRTPIIFPTNLNKHSWFLNLPDSSKDISAALQQGAITFFFNGRTFCAWNLSSNSKSDSKNCQLRLGPGGDSRFSKLPPPFSKKLTGAFNLDNSSAIFISGDMWIQWNVADAIPTAVGSISSGASMFSGLDISMLDSGIDCCVENPNQMGSVYFFSGGEYILYDCLAKKTIDGPNALGSPSTPFAGLVAPFIPSQANVCDVYLQNIKANTDYPKTTCVDDPKRPYQWMSKCLFSDVSCDAAGGVYNDIGGFCGSAISKGATPLRNVDPAKRASDLAHYMQSCRPVSQFDYVTMKTTEQKNYDELNSKLSRTKAEKLKLASKVSAQEKNLQTLNAALQALKLELTNNDTQACHPNFICLKSTNTGSIKDIPLGCDQATVKAILAKSPMTDADLQALIQLIVKKGALNDYPIMQHPDYSDLIQTNNVTKCAPPNDKVITDFPLKDFPDFPKYIRKDQLLTAKQAVAALATQSNQDSVLPIPVPNKQESRSSSEDRTPHVLPAKSVSPWPDNRDSTKKCRHGKFSSIIRRALSGE